MKLPDAAVRNAKANGKVQKLSEFIGFPIWWGTIPMPFFTLLEKYDVGSRTVIPFCTHEGSRFGRGEQDLRRLCPQARIFEGFEVRGSRAGGTQRNTDAWLRKIGLLTE